MRQFPATSDSRQLPATILLVEDDGEFRQMVAAALSREGHHVHGVSTGQEALDYLATHRVDLALLDYFLPDMRGGEIIRRLRERNRDVTFIVVSGNSSEAMAVEMMKLGARDYLVKNAAVLAVLPPLVTNLIHEIVNQRRLSEFERAYKVTERRYLALSQISPVGIFYTDVEGSVLEVNDRWCEISGCPRELALGNGWSRAVHPDDLAELLLIWRHVVARQTPGSAEWRFKHADGREVYAYAVAVPERAGNGMVTGFIGSVIDITQRKMAELALEASEQLNRQMVDSMPGGMMQFDKSGRIVRANAESARAVGVPLEKLVGLSIYDFEGMGVDESGNVVAVEDSIVLRCLRSGKAQTNELFGFNSFDGKLRWGLINCVPLYDSRMHAVSGVVMTFLDITHRKEIDEALRRSEAQLRALVEHLPFDVFALDAAGRYSMLNSTAIQHWGNMLGRHPEDLGVPAGILMRWQANNRRAMSGEIVRGEVEYRHNGEMRTYYNILAPIRDDGHVQGIVGVNIDITERKQAEDRARLHLAELAHVTRLATMGELSSELAHEINQPLYAIGNYAEAALNILQHLDNRVLDMPREWLTQIAEQARRSGEIVRNLRRFVRKSPPRREAVSVAPLIRDVVRLLEFDLRHEGVLIRQKVESGLPDITADLTQIQQVLVNLIRNAIEASSEIPRNQREVIVAAGRYGPMDLEISVSDFGRGVSAEQLPRLFEPFFSTKPEGLGMGLAISQSLVTDHGGKLWAELNADRGMTFHLTLPINASPNQAEPFAAAAT